METHIELVQNNEILIKEVTKSMKKEPSIGVLCMREETNVVPKSITLFVLSDIFMLQFK